MYFDFFTHISDHDPHLTIVNLLYSSGLFDKATRDAMTDSRKQRVNQIRCLLAELEVQIESRPDTYRKLVSILKQGEKCCFSDLAMLLQQKYGTVNDITFFWIEKLTALLMVHYVYLHLKVQQLTHIPCMDLWDSGGILEVYTVYSYI